MKYFIILFFLIGSGDWAAQAQEVLPFRYWTFNSERHLLDSISHQKLNAGAYGCNVGKVDGKSGGGIYLKDTNCTVVTASMRSNVADEFSVEFYFKGSQFTFLTFPKQALILQFGYSRILFRTTTVLKDGQINTDNFVIQLNGSGRRSYNYYIDDEWHHFVFTASLRSGKKEVWIDGECLDIFSKSIPLGRNFEFGLNDGFRNTGMIDELAFYNGILDPELLQQHIAEGREGKSYTFSVNKHLSRPGLLLNADKDGVDTMEFAPGYPLYTVYATDQLKTFPLPRYTRGVEVRRNMSWMDITYLHRELRKNGGSGFGRTNARRAVELSKEMADKWNYYIDIPLLRADSITSNKEYGDSMTVAGALVTFANQQPQYATSTISVEAQISPFHAGFDSKRAYGNSQFLPEEYYLKDSAGRPLIQNGKKWLSPLSPLDIIQRDGGTSRFYLAQLRKHLTRPPMLINENGELFGHIRKEELLRQDPVVWSHYRSSGMTPSEYSGWFQYRIDSTYRAELMRSLDSSQSHFSLYNVSATNPEYWPDYRSRRLVNRWIGDTVYSTPSFYPATPDNWRNVRGPNNGFGTISRGRVVEIELGDKYFSPFVAAGWGKEEDNIRPAQWLALLKSMVMLGADFFYTGYFNVTGAAGRWPDGVGPNDPRGYAYQIAIPSYAQAIRTWVSEFFEKGELLNPADPKDLVGQFRFKGNGENELILVRQLGKKYLIYGSLQPNSNVKGNVPFEKSTTIELGGQKLSFMIRRQGSMYVLDFSTSIPIFYQIDGWHQYEHPYYWTRELRVEAECTRSDSQNLLTTTYSGNKLDFTNFNTFVRLKRGDSLVLAVPPKRSPYSLAIRLGNISKEAKVLIVGSVGTTARLVRPRDSGQTISFTEKEVDKIGITTLGDLVIKVEKGVVDIDGFVL